MEKGQLRCDANVSVRKNASDPLGTRVEIKNLNSFKAVKAAIQYEVGRQSEALEKGEKISQETVLWDDNRQKTVSMRSKEQAHDYRYFPEPDLVPFFVSTAELEEAKKSIPELPKAKEERFVFKYNFSEYDAKLLNQDPQIASFFEQSISFISNSPFAKSVTPDIVKNWLNGPVLAYLNANNVSLSQTQLTPILLVGTAGLVQSGEVSFQTAKEKILPVVIKTGTDSKKVLQDQGLAQVSDDISLEKWIREAIEANPKVVADFKSGKETAAMFLVGQVMRKSQGKANPGKVKEMMTRVLQSV